ncbi:putative leucine-rich repeat-containing protein DDB_G0290503 isoform X2 [Halyomorpha halys]|uniref:putative leucine-rich repeat-containing protein DDB_G0290503 isoform X2 n=1 Tax=Halyomorpha halys TaxID=286706 RepID=UPI0006D4CA61|nr:myosin-2 heavy chain isoform X2 [Halyomorpha halys]
MHHVKPMSKGDPLCPLGFHPQVRWPTRCKRCFRDYKEHGNRGSKDDVQLRKDELTVSTPTLSSSTASRSRMEPRIPDSTLGSRTWTSSSNLSSVGISSRNDDPYSNNSSNRLSSSNSSWTSTPNLVEPKDAKEDVSVSFTLPRRRPKPDPDTGQDENDEAKRTQYTVRRRTSGGLSSLSNNYKEEPQEVKTSYRSRLLQQEEKSGDILVKLPPKKPSPAKEVQRILTKGKTLIVSREDSSSSDEDTSSVTESRRKTKESDTSNSKLQAQVEQLQKELEVMKIKCEKTEREKSDFMLRRLDAATGRASSSEVLKLQQKVNELRNTVEDLQVEKKSLTQKVRDMEYEMDSVRSSVSKKENEALKEKLKAAEQMCEDLMEENEDVKKELKEMEEEMDEMHDKFREDRADEYTMLKKELEQATKNCRILSFKLRKSERKAEQLEIEKFEAEQRCREVAGGQSGLDKAERIKQLEHDLNVANETAARLQKELEEANSKVKSNDKEKGPIVKKKAPKLGSMPKTPSTEKMSRESLTRGDSQEDPVQLLRDLQDSLEREADLREQLRYAEEEILRLQVKKKLTKLTPDVIPEKVVEKLCDQDFFTIEKFEKLKREMISTQSPAISETNLSKNDSVEAAENAILNEGFRHCSIQRAGTDVSLHVQEISCPKVDKSVQYELCYVNDSKNSFNNEDIAKQKKRHLERMTDTLFRSISLPDVLKLTPKDTSTQTDPQYVNPLLRNNIMPFGMFLPHAPVLSPLAALILPLAHRHSPSHQRLTPEPVVEKDEGISDEEDPSELKILLELNEQEASVLRKKVEELENERDHLNKKVKELQEKVSNKASEMNKRALIQQAEPKKSNGVYEKKIKVLEEEMSELRKKLIEKERECERLHAELTIAPKKVKTMQKSKSLDGDQQTVDLKRQLQVVETEASILRTKTQNLETENEKLLSENKKLSLIAASKTRSSSVERTLNESKLANLEKQLEESNKKIKELESGKKTLTAKSDSTPVAEVEKLKNQLKKAENEKKKIEETLQRLKEAALTDAVKFYKSRTPKKPTDITTKLQLKKMVDDLENEIAEVIVVLKKAEENNKLLSEKQSNVGNSSLKEELDEAKSKFDSLIKETKEECQKKDSEIQRLNTMIQDLESDKLKALRERDTNKTKYEKEIEKLKDNKSDLEKQKTAAKEEIDKLKNDIKASAVLQTELQDLKKQIESLNKDLKKEKSLTGDLKAKLEVANKATEESSKLQKEIAENDKKVENLEKKLLEVEEKLKRSEKLASSKKEKLLKLEKEYTELNKKYATLEKNNDSLSITKHEVEAKFEDAERKLKKLQEELENKNSEIKKLEVAAKKKEKPVKAGDSNENQQEIVNANNMIKDLTMKLEKAERIIKEKEEELNDKEKEIEIWEKKTADLEMDYQASRKLMDRLKATHEKELRNKDTELAQLKSKMSEEGQIKELKQELEGKIESLEIALESERHEYDELTKRYEELEEEHVVMKATLVQEKEKIQSQLIKAANEMEEVETELRSLKESYSIKQELWAKEKHRLEDKSKDCDTLILEKSRLQAICDQKQSEIEQLRKEADGLSEQTNYMRKDNEDLRRKIEDYEKLEKIQRNVSGDISSLQADLNEYKSRLALEEKSKKKELSSLKMRYDNRLSIITDELVSMQSQMARYKKERDSYKHLLEAARRNIADLKASGSSVKYTTDETEWRSQIAILENQIASLEDDLSEAKSETSRLKTELISERSQWEVKNSELVSRLNELEEEKILSSGRTKITGTKTRMELAWHKEREEQHRLLQETSTLARDLRQTLFEVERERDRERLEAKRKLDQLKKSNEEEQEEIRKKLNEMQCDLLELRDAHAKLRTTNEKLRREKDKLERERELLKQTITIKNNMEKEEERQIISVAQLVEELTVLAPDLFPSKPRPPVVMPTPPARRKGPKSREASPNLERKDYSRESSIGKDDTKSQEVQEILRRLTEAANQLKKVQQEDKATLRRAFGSYRSSSIDSDGGSDISSVKRRSLQRKPSILRKSLSLEQTTAQEQQVWQMEDNEGSMTSVQSLEDSEKFRQSLYRRENSLDSRLSGGSTQSEIIPSDKKKKLGLFGKLKKLTKSRSIDQESDAGSTSQLDPGSDSSLNTVDERVGGKQFKDKLSGMFRKSGSTSRGNSQERSLKPSMTPKNRDSTQRPLVSSPGDTLPRNMAQKPPNTAPVQRKMKK